MAEGCGCDAGTGVAIGCRWSISGLCRVFSAIFARFIALRDPFTFTRAMHKVPFRCTQAKCGEKDSTCGSFSAQSPTRSSEAEMRQRRGRLQRRLPPIMAPGRRCYMLRCAVGPRLFFEAKHGGDHTRSRKKKTRAKNAWKKGTGRAKSEFWAKRKKADN